MTFLWLLGATLFVTFLMIVVRGAPFVPTRSKDLHILFELYTFNKHDVLIDLGSGDGRILAEAAKRGVASVGYELNPLLVLWSRLRLRPYSRFARVDLRDFWLSSFPSGTAVVFVFLAAPFMARLDRKMQSEATKLGRDILLISYGMKIAGKPVENVRGGYLVYRYKA